MKCYNCGAENAEIARFCTECGRPLAEKTETSAKPEKKKSLKWLYIMLIAAICISLLVAGGVWFASANNPYDKKVKIGYEHLEAGSYEEAIIAFDEAIEIEPRKKPAYEGKIEVYVVTEEYDMIPDVIEAAAEYGVHVTLEKYDEEVRNAVASMNEGFKSGNVIEVNSKVIHTDSTGIYVRNCGEDTETKVYDGDVFIRDMLSDGKIIYFVVDEDKKCKKLNIETGEIEEIELKLVDEKPYLGLLGKCGDFLYFAEYNGENGSETYLLNEKNGESYVFFDDVIEFMRCYKDKLYYNNNNPFDEEYGRLYESNLDGRKNKVLLEGVLYFEIYGNKLYFIEYTDWEKYLDDSDSVTGTVKCMNLDTYEIKILKENIPTSPYYFTDFGFTYRTSLDFPQEWHVSYYNSNKELLYYGRLADVKKNHILLEIDDNLLALITKDKVQTLKGPQDTYEGVGYYDGKIYYGANGIHSQKAEEYVATPSEPEKPMKTVEEIEALVADYFNTNYSEEYDGNFVVFNDETREIDIGYSMVVRFQANYNTTSANRLFADVEVDVQTGELFWCEEYVYTLW